MSVKTKDEAQAYCDDLMKSGYVASCVPVKTEEEWMVELTFKTPPELVEIYMESKNEH